MDRYSIINVHNVHIIVPVDDKLVNEFPTVLHDVDIDYATHEINNY